MKCKLPRTIILSTLVLFLFSSLSWAANEFPGRVKYPRIPVISKEELKQQFNSVVIVDTRSRLEFATLRINGAKNIPVGSNTFAQQIKNLRSKTSRTIVFYCNGRSCMKSYRGVMAAKRAQVKNTIAYDAGIFDWARAYPDLASLLGNSPVQPSDIISKKAFKARNLAPDVFIDKAYKMGKKSMVLDIRDNDQRSAAGLFPGKEHWVSLNDHKKLNGYLNQAKRENKTLFIYDEVGKQVRWLQYALEQKKIKNYYFMKAGVKGYYKNMMGGFNF